MIARTITIAAAVLLTACAAPVWRDANGNQSTRADDAACELEYRRTLAGTRGGFYEAMMAEQVRSACMDARGFRRYKQ